MMPDHLHGILFVHETLPVHLSQVIIGFKTGCNRILHNMQGKTAAQPLRPFFDLHIGSYTYNGIGNRRLLLTSQRKAVRISRRVTITEKDLA